MNGIAIMTLLNTMVIVVLAIYRHGKVQLIHEDIRTNNAHLVRCRADLAELLEQKRKEAYSTKNIASDGGKSGDRVSPPPRQLPPRIG